MLPLWCSAKVTVTDYTPQEGDDAHHNESFEPREISVYVRKCGDAPILVSHETRIYTRETDPLGIPLRRIARRVGFGWLTRTETTVEYPQDGAVPSHLRGLRTLVSNADGSETATAYALSNGCLVATAHTAFNGVERQTYTRTASDSAYRLPIREETRLASDGSLLNWSERAYDDIRRLRSVTYSNGTSETNAYSCCRLLWRRDREGRTVLRSAQTGIDSLYYADEDVWLSDVSTNGAYRIVQHFFDGFGRETETVTHTGSTPGEAAEAYEPSADQMPFTETVEYIDDDRNGASERIDGRGKVTYGSSWRQASAEQTGENVYGMGGWSDALTTTVTRYRNGGTATERWWNGGWRREESAVTYGEGGRRIDTVTVSASDHAAVTNSVMETDALGRLASVRTPTGSTTFVYDGASSRLQRMEFTAGDVVRMTYVLHNSAGEQVGTVLDGTTNRTDVAYEKISNVWWRVTTSAVTGPGTNSVTIVREQVSGLGGNLRGRTVSMDAAGLEIRSERTFDESTGIETESETASDGTWKAIRRRHGLVLETETAAGRTINAYDGFGRMVCVQRSVGTGGEIQPVSRTEYAPWGDVIAVETYTNGVDTTRESYGHDEFGNRVAVTNALGEVVETDYDVFGNETAVRGATYPVEMDYDTENRRIALRTTRDGLTWDETRWAYDAATGSCLSKTYADGATVTYTYTSDNLPLRTIYASGRWKENVYDLRRQVVAVAYSDGETVSLAYDAFLNEIAFSNDVATANLDRDAKGNCTNDTVVVGGESKTTHRTFDGFSRLTGIDSTIYDYDADGLLASISNDIALVEYAFTPDRLDAGYSLTISNGVTFVRDLVRDVYRRSLVTGITSIANGIGVGSLAYTYDALNRPTTRNGDMFGYNARSEVTAANVSGIFAAYGYDEIGNSTNWTANCLNQYTQFAYDLDGNMTQCGDWTYTYDAANRLKTVSSNGVLLVTNFYDARSRRVKKVTSDATTTFFYDDWNLIEERVAFTNGTTSTVRYYWGKDLSGTLHGAGGIGGLLYLTIDNAIFIPVYDNNGNIMRYLDANGTTVAQYIYDAFGNLISKSGPLADYFRHRFSTKYLDTESGLCYYDYRFYSPPVMRWLNRDPIQENGGLNLYGFCGNNAICNHDKDGRAYFIKRSMFGLMYQTAQRDIDNQEWAHEQLIFEDGKSPSDAGYFGDSKVKEDPGWQKSRVWVRVPGHYNDCVMRKALKSVQPKPYKMRGEGHYNCQDYADDLRARYGILIRDKNIRCECGLSK